MLSPKNPLSDEPSVSWRNQVLRRSAGTLAAAIVIAGIGPAIANAAGADVANPVAVALRASGKGLAKAFGADEIDPCAPVAEPTVDVSASPLESPDEGVSADPSTAPSEEPTLDPVEECEEAEETESPSPSPSETESEEPAEEGNHGQIVSTVAKCAPRGKDPLLDVEGAPSNHGGYVRVAAHGDTLTLPWGSYDLSTLAGAEDLCASLDAARADLEETEDKKAKKDKGKRGKPDHAKGGKGGKH